MRLAPVLVLGLAPLAVARDHGSAPGTVSLGSR
jgi:hypothetical protein